MAKLNIKIFALSCGIAWGMAIFVLGILNKFFGWGTAAVSLMSTLYLGYQATFLGSLIGFCWGFIDAAVVGIVVAWIYNRSKKEKG